MSRKWFGKEMPFLQFPLSLFGLFFPHNTGTTLRDLLKTCCCYLVFIKTWKIPWKGLLVIIFYGIFGNSKTGQIFYHLNLSTSWSHTETFFWLVTQFATLETKRELRPKHVPQLFLRSSPVRCRSAIGQFLTVPEVFSKVNSARCPRF